MVYRHAIDATTYVFNDLRDLLAKATPPRSGDRLAGIVFGIAISLAVWPNSAVISSACANDVAPTGMTIRSWMSMRRAAWAPPPKI